MTATPIPTIEDLMRALDENPEWLEALRVRLLTRELLELPQRFTEMAATTAEMQRQFTEMQRQFTEMQRQFAEMRRDFAEIRRQFAEIQKQFAEIQKQFAEIQKQFAAMQQEFAAVRSLQITLQNDMAPIKGAHARNVAVENAVFLAQDMGLRLTRVLTREDIAALLLAGNAGAPTNVIRSFRNTDLVMETADESGEVCYAAVEASYTADGRDTIRAVRNAGILTRLTGKPARAAVAGFRLDNEILDATDSGEIFWHQLDPEAANLTAE